LKDAGIGGRIIRRWIKEWDRRPWTGLIWIRIGWGTRLL
jgi:hypothetical protein